MNIDITNPMHCKRFSQKEPATILDGAYPFLALNKFCKDQNIKSAFVSKLILKKENAIKAFWVYCQNERRKQAQGSSGYSLTEERIQSLKQVGICIAIIVNAITMQTSTVVWVNDNNLFELSLKKLKAHKKVAKTEKNQNV